MHAAGVRRAQGGCKYGCSRVGARIANRSRCAAPPGAVKTQPHQETKVPKIPTPRMRLLAAAVLAAAVSLPAAAQTNIEKLKREEDIN